MSRKNNKFYDNIFICIHIKYFCIIFSIFRDESSIIVKTYDKYQS
jgi:hypothetical protein